MNHQQILGNSLEELKKLPDNSIETCITDPPYGINMSSRGWDVDLPLQEIWNEVFRVLKPGAFCLVFNCTRLCHKSAIMLETAGFEIRDLLMWVYATGFPKSHNFWKKMEGENKVKWKGYGSALSPAVEPIIMAMKPLEGTFLNNAIQNDVAGLNIYPAGIKLTQEDINNLESFGRIRNNDLANNEIKRFERFKPTDEENNFGNTPGLRTRNEKDDEIQYAFNKQTKEEKLTSENPDLQRYTKCIHGQENNIIEEYKERIAQSGRWPKNVIINHDMIEELGDYSRFFYIAKPCKSEKNKYITSEEKTVERTQHGEQENMKSNPPSSKSKNFHPTVKPLDLIRYLCVLTSPPNGGTVLDPFAGSFTTSLAAEMTGRNSICIEIEPEYVEIGKQRLNGLLNEKKDKENIS